MNPSLLQAKTDNTESTEYERFKDFTRRIVAVPKREVDEAEKTLPPLKRGRKKNTENAEKESK